METSELAGLATGPNVDHDPDFDGADGFKSLKLARGELFSALGSAKTNDLAGALGAGANAGEEWSFAKLSRGCSL
jgi:hypothetical protein